MRLSSNLIVEVRRTVSYRGLVLHLHVSSEVYCGDVCGEQHLVAVEGFVRVRTEEQPLDPCCMRQPTGVVEWAYLPLGEIEATTEESSDEGTTEECSDELLQRSPRQHPGWNGGM